MILTLAQNLHDIRYILVFGRAAWCMTVELNEMLQYSGWLNDLSISIYKDFSLVVVHCNPAWSLSTLCRLKGSTGFSGIHTILKWTYLPSPETRDNWAVEQSFWQIHWQMNHFCACYVIMTDQWDDFYSDSVFAYCSKRSYKCK